MGIDAATQESYVNNEKKRDVLTRLYCYSNLKSLSLLLKLLYALV